MTRIESMLRTIRNWLNRQYRITFRSILTGLLASGMTGDEVIERAHELTMLALQKFKQEAV